MFRYHDTIVFDDPRPPSVEKNDTAARSFFAPVVNANRSSVEERSKTASVCSRLRIPNSVSRCPARGSHEIVVCKSPNDGSDVSMSLLTIRS